MAIDEGEEVGPGNAHRGPLRACAWQAHGHQFPDLDEAVDHPFRHAEHRRGVPNPVQLGLQHEGGAELGRALHITDGPSDLKSLTASPRRLARQVDRTDVEQSAAVPARTRDAACGR